MLINMCHRSIWFFAPDAMASEKEEQQRGRGDLTPVGHLLICPQLLQYAPSSWFPIAHSVTTQAAYLEVVGLQDNFQLLDVNVTMEVRKFVLIVITDPYKHRNSLVDLSQCTTIAGRTRKPAHGAGQAIQEHLAFNLSRTEHPPFARNPVVDLF
jgi:hypothetical protein